MAELSFLYEMMMAIHGDIFFKCSNLEKNFTLCGSLLDPSTQPTYFLFVCF